MHGVISPLRQQELPSAREWDVRLRRALARSEFALFAQPIVPLLEPGSAQHELLLRLRRDQLEMIAPGAFLPAAERSGLVREIDLWVLHAAIQLLSQLQRAGHNTPVQVNISALSICDPRLAGRVRELIDQYEVDAENLVFELTETAALTCLDQATEFACAIRQMGARMALDDFGAGFASFRYLKHLPLDYLKIDGEFVRNLRHDPTDQVLVQSMAELGRRLGKRVIAEFVSDEETVALLREYGVDYGQGFHLGTPAPVSELLAP